MTKRIEGHDVIAPGFTNQAIQDALKLEAELNKLVGHFKQLFTLSSQMANAANTNSSAGISNLTTAYTQATTASKGYANTLSEQARLEQRLLELLQGERDEVIRLQKEIQQLTAAKKAKMQVDAEEIGAYQKAVNELHKLKRAIKDLYIAGKEQEQGTKNLIVEYEKLNKAVRAAEQAVGEHQRNVGNYASGQKKYNYEMFQMTQILRELPNFAISSRIGIMSLSNNLPQLGDAFKRVREDGNSFIQTLGIFAKSILSWQTLMLVGITIAIQFADEIGNTVKGWFGYSQEVEKAKKKQDELNKSMENTIDTLDQVGSQQIANNEILIKQMQSYYSVASDVNESDERRKAALEALNKISPEHIGNLTLENIATQEAADSINNYILRLRDLARAQAVFEQYKALNLELIKQEQSTGKMKYERLLYGNTQEQLSNLTQKEIESAKYAAKVAMANSKFFNTEQEAFEYYINNAIQARIDAIDARLAPLRNKMQELELIMDPTFVTDGEGDGKKGGKVKTPKEKKDTQLRDMLSMIQNQYQVEANEQERLHELRLQQAGQDNFKLQMEEKKHQQAMIDLKMKSLSAQIAIMETAKAKLTDAELQQLALLRSQYELLAVQLVRDGFVLYNSGLTEKSKKDADGFIVGKRGPTSKDSDKPKDMVKDIMDLAKAISDIMTRMEKAQQTQLDRQIDATKRKQETLRLLAAQGVKDAKDNLAFEEKKQAELEQKQRQIERAAIRRQTALAAMNAYASKSQRGEANAVGSTIGDLTALLGFASSIPGFNKGIENVSDIDAIAKRNTAVDPFLAWLHPNERVLTAQQNAMIGSMSNEQLANLAYNFKNGLYITNSSDATLSELREIKTAIKNSQPPSWSWNDIEKAIEYKYSKGDKIHREIHKVGGIWGG